MGLFILAGALLAVPGCSHSDHGNRADNDLTESLSSALIGTESIGLCQHHDPLRRPLFGDLHVHTSFSFDAYLAGTRNDPDTAYEFARGQTIPLPPYDSDGNATRSAQLARPLDFAAATDHAEFIGEVSLCTTPGAPGYNSTTCQAFRDTPTLAFVLWGIPVAGNDPDRFAMCGVGDRRCESAAADVWQEAIDAANRHYDSGPECSFTTLVGYEWTGTPGGSMLHRNVIFANDIVPEAPTSYFEQSEASGLWTELEAQCLNAGTGCEVLAIPHNPNYSNGQIFIPPDSLNEAEQRA
ncbi:MAG: DUF3604 domain-containing protein, partial [Myxococcota bacterium]